MILNGTARNDYLSTLLNQYVVERTLLLPSIGLILKLIAKLALIERGWLQLLVTLLNNLRRIYRLYVVQSLTHMNCSFYTIPSIFVILFHHNICS